MSGTAGPADDSKRASDNSHTAPITPMLNAKLKDLSPEVAERVRDVVSRKKG
jgi:hypothetical protein